MARQIEKSQNIEQSIWHRMTGLKFTPHTSPECPTLVGFIAFYCDYTGFEYGSIGMHTDGKEFWVRWPYTKKDFFSIAPRNEQVRRAYTKVFLEVMDEMKAQSKPLTVSTPVVKDKVTVTRDEKGCTTCPCAAKRK